ncbi:MAG: GTP cyclohydrolase II [Pseudomonadota bacterium]
MSFHVTIEERLGQARADLRMGVPVVLRDGADGAVILAAETLVAERLTAIIDLGEVDLAITRRRAETLRARVYDGDIARIALPADCRLAWVHATADPAADLQVPLKGPYLSRREGSTDLHRAALRLAKQAHLLPAALVVRVADPVAVATEAGLHLLDIAALATEPSPLAQVAAARVPLAVSERARVHVFRPSDGGEEHYAVEVGTPDRAAPVLARLHSSCFTGDLIGSLKCDCGAQLDAALAQIGAEGAGVLLYLNQEGRGIGLANKMRAYALQDQGFDTVEANHRLGFEDDERDFRLGAQILRALGFSAVRLMTNNPGKIAMMEASGVSVAERVPLQVGHTAHNARYLATKAAKSGHLL